MHGPGFPLPESLFDRLFNLRTGTVHEFSCPTCDRVTDHYNTIHSAQMDNLLLRFLTRVLTDLSGLGNLLEGKALCVRRLPNDAVRRGAREARAPMGGRAR
jgi:hypothetical protein